MTILRRLLKVNAQPDVAAIVAANKDPSVTAIEARLAELQKAEMAAGAEWARAADQANPQIRGPKKTPESIAEAQARVDEINVRRGAIARESAELRARKAGLAPASLAAVRGALAPVQAAAAQDISDAVTSLYAAIARWNAVSSALRENGSDGDAALLVPVAFPVVDHFVRKVAKG